MNTPLQLDQRSLALHRLVAEKIRKNPALLAHVQRTLLRWQHTVSVHSQPYVQAWLDVVNHGWERCVAVAEEDSPWATALRQSSPLTGILSHQERFLFLRDWKKLHAKK